MKLHYTFKYTILVILFISIAKVISAQYQSYVDPLNRTLDKTNAKAGSLPGSVNVNSLGAANYEIPIFFSPGSAGMQPILSVFYNSHNGDGIMGQGWDLAGLSEIRRVQKNYYHDSQVDGVDLQNTDMFALDSNRLVITSGTYGADNSIYATEYETFVKVTAHGSAGTGPSWFTVETKDGRTLEYGNTADSKVEAYSSPTVYMWRLNKVMDQSGNTMKFIYNEVNGESYILRIDYTTNSAADLTTPYNSVKFEYATRTDVNSKYVGGSKIPITKLLTQIKVETENSAQVRKYQFKYFKDNFNKSLLNEIVEYGSDNTYFNSTVIGWGAATAAIASNNAFNNSTINYNYPGDFNGDGRTDMVVTPRKTNYTSSDEWKLYLANADGTFPSASSPNDEGYLNSLFKGFTVADVDGNGYDDLLWKSVETIYYNCNPYLCNPHPCDGNPPLRMEDNTESESENVDVLLQPYDTCWDVCYETCSYIRVSFLNYCYNNSSGIERGDTFYDLVFDNADPGIYPVPADFEGDGKPDYLILYSDKTHYVTKINGVNRVGMSFSNPNEVRIIDFDGDGKKEVLVIINNNSFIYQYSVSTQSFSTIYTNTTYPTKDHRIFPGDFNGDGKTDILSWKSGENWKIRFSTGTGFATSTNTPALNPADPNYSLIDYNYYTADFNGDGKDDILEAYKLKTASKLKVFYSQGDGIFNPEINSYSKSQINQDYFSFGDFNGDGKDDVFYYDYSLAANYVYISFFHKDEIKYFVAAIANGLNFITKISYNRLNFGSAFYVKYSDAEFPVYDFNGPYFAVDTIETDNGFGTFIPEYYTWAGAKKHRQGRGFVGFMKMIHRTDAINTLDANIFGLDTSYFFISPLREFSLNTSLAGDTTQLSINTNDVKNFGNKRIFPYVKQSIVKNRLELSTFTSTYNYDDYGNLLRVKTIFNNDEQGQGVEGVKSATNVFEQYGNYGIHNKLIFTTDSSTYTNEPSYVRQKAFTYDSLGLLLTEKTDPTKGKEVTKTYSNFTAFGLPQQMTISASGLTDRTTLYNYDNKGRWVTKITDPLGNFVEKTYYSGTGNLNTETSIDNLVTTYSYDAFGCLTETETPQDNHITTTYNWDASFINGIYSLYRVTTDAPYQPFNSVYYDYLGRELKSQTENPTGTVSSITEYSSNGRIHRKTLPYMSESNIKWEYFNYDDYGRVERDSLTSESYTSYSYSGKTTTLARGGTYVKSTRTNSLGNTVYSNDLGSAVNSTFGSNGQVKQMNADGTIISFYYDEYGRQDSIVNPNSGKTSYQYNAYGELTSQTDANNNSISLQYDDLGRITAKTTPDNTINYTYVDSGFGKEQIQSISGSNGVSQTYTYNDDGLPSQLTESITGDQSFTTSFTYDGWNNLDTVTYPSGFWIKNHYTNGYLTTIKKPDNSVIWELDSINALGQPVQCSLGPNSLLQKFSYDYYGNVIQKKIMNMVQQFSYDPVNGNLLQRSIKRRLMDWKTETFGYDSRSRLDTSVVQDMPAVNISYDSRGNITHKSGIGDYSYNGTKINRLDNISADSLYSPLAGQVITYTSENLSSSIAQEPYYLQFLYGPSGQRIKTVLKEDGDTIKTKYFSLDYEKEITASGVRNLHYIYSPYGLEAVMITQDATENLYLTETDNLGSIISLLDEEGSYVEKYLYDAWGRRRNPTDWSYDNIPTTTLIDLGYTGHEHLDKFGLINMNGRMYDPYIGRFLSVDPIIQFTGNSQSFNGYGYCLNNPLKYTDPSGMRLEARPNPADAGYPYNPEAAVWLENYFNQWESRYGSPGGGGGTGGYYYDTRNEVYRNGRGENVTFDEYYDNKIRPDLAKFFQEYFSVSIDFKDILQKETHWCAFAATAAIFQYFGFNIDQTTLANAYYKANNIPSGSNIGAHWEKSEGYDNDFLRQFFYDHTQNIYLYTGIGSSQNVPSIYSIRDHLVSRHPILTNINEGFGEEGHAMVITRISVTYGGINIQLSDPANARHSYGYPAYSQYQQQTIAIWGVNVNF